MASLPRRFPLTGDPREDVAPLIRWEALPTPRSIRSLPPLPRVTVVDRTPSWAVGPTYEPSWECTCPTDCLHDHENE